MFMSGKDSREYVNGVKDEVKSSQSKPDFTKKDNPDDVLTDIISTRVTLPESKRLHKTLEYRRRKGLSKDMSEMIRQMINNLYDNDYGDFPFG